MGGWEGGLRATQGLISKSLVLHREEDAISLLVLLLMYLYLSSSLSQSLYRCRLSHFICLDEKTVAENFEIFLGLLYSLRCYLYIKVEFYATSNLTNGQVDKNSDTFFCSVLIFFSSS